ncbi:MAG TPA: A/G-specific adenine glycosylase [Sphingomicrobium sp.]|jgi:A/G-specific adenine glycosylase|nr:A/G-specific adenine glycosylase [Sphingomicrobium sp.]
MVTANAASRLIQHYVDNFRQLPWRSPPGAPAPDPYVVWLSEVMLQQTMVATVAPRFERFVERWPTVRALAAAPDEDILSEWAGLGYYARARNLIACAREVAARGGFPATAGELRELPGIGAYTSCAIAAIAFGEKAPAVDTNVERVISRLRGRRRVSRLDIEQDLLDMMESEPPGDLVQALMDLGATICRPKQPNCRQCPLRARCAAAASGDPESFPEPRPRKARPQRCGVAWWIERDGHVWLVRRPPKGLLGGMAALPGTEWTDPPQSALDWPERDDLGAVRHVFTHFSLDLFVRRRSEPLGEGWWQPLDRLAEAGLPTLYRKAAALALMEEKRRAA